MDDTDAFLTQTIVGAPYSIYLGHQLEASNPSTQGIEVPMRGGDARLSRMWKEWIVINRSSELVGQPRRRPGQVRHWLERNSLLLALLGVLSLMVTVAFWGLILWK
ncbi:MAG: hypothetical protein U1D25_16805 [Hydrogenophaga sp.]|uniref:hypothetical protein n=1 Tax=Hydrogenophaga sp. TaxID=1904254 RepID=UPI002ABA0BC2|nr:hypothetical protein [Hydrogenophaga sp.]MDZ4189746.1 hypothetical protein [Hydrogenophaga sp.]